MKEGKDNINRKERKRERHVGGMEEGRVREKRKADKKEGKKAGRLDGRELLRRKKGRILWLSTTRGQCSTG